MWWAIAGVALLGGAMWGPVASNVEQAKYEVVQAQGNIEIRDYAPMIVAEAEVQGEREEAINQGFRIIADYIFGNNSASEKVAMTAPVIQQTGEKIAMTAPVTQQGGDAAWNVRFIMPAKYTLATLPKPNNPAVKLKQVAGTTYAVIRFSGVAGEESLKSHTEQLNAYMREHKLTPVGSPVYAFYNPPFTLPFLRRNEVQVQIKPNR
ncbi:MAG: heme-binding protein [Proteobacteria bacterium]|nr:heme-binding protein [Pseudomonadota bacterium]